MPANESDDPLTRALAPPPDETPEERTIRVRKEIEAQRISDQIDDALKQEKAALKKKRVMKMLLLGQSESGKSTTLKNMQLAYAPKAFAAERASWRAVIQLNLIRSIIAILDALTAELATASRPQETHNPYGFTSPPPSPTPDDQHTSAQSSTIPLSHRPALSKLKLRLAPLRQVEADLKARIGAGSAEESWDGTVSPSVSSPAFGPSRLSEDDLDEAALSLSLEDQAFVIPNRRPNPKEVFVRSHSAWKEKEKESVTGSWRLSGTGHGSTSSRGSRPVSTHANPSGHSIDADVYRDSATDVLAGCAEDMVALWLNEDVREAVSRRKVMKGLWDGAEYFLNNITRIAKRDYEPTNDDVLRARIRTLGVQEYSIKFEHGNERDFWNEWSIYDVGGSRTSRAAWLPYFSEVHAILFLAPISAFDERLAEDKRVNRLEDSFALWQAICKSEVLKDTIIILFMNKCDLLEKKLAAGIKINRYMTSFGARSNDADTFATYLLNKFRELHVTLSPVKRAFYGYKTSVVDAEATATTLSAVRDGILQTHLRDASFV